MKNLKCVIFIYSIDATFNLFFFFMLNIHKGVSLLRHKFGPDYQTQCFKIKNGVNNLNIQIEHRRQQSKISSLFM